MTDYLLDACAVLAYLNDEPGADVVNGLIDRARRGEVTLSMHAANLIEVYYDRIRGYGPDVADAIIRGIYDDWPVSIIETFDHTIVRDAAYSKVDGKMSFADTILVATARSTGATVVSCDHVELGPVQRLTSIPFLWIRPQF